MNKESRHIAFDGKNILAIADELTADNVANLRCIGEDYIKQCPLLIFDLAAVSHCDSAALSLLISWLRYAKQQKKEVQFVNLPKQLLDIAALSGLEKILKIN